jgi:hypothetical protein
MVSFSIISRVPFISELFKKDISQMVQGFPELHRIDQGMTVEIGFVMFMQIVACKHKACYLASALPEPDILKITAHAHEECSSEDVCGF